MSAHVIEVVLRLRLEIEVAPVAAVPSVAAPATVVASPAPVVATPAAVGASPDAPAERAQPVVDPPAPIDVPPAVAGESTVPGGAGARAPRPAKVSAEQRAAAVARYVAGESSTAIAADLGVTSSGVLYWVAAAGQPRRLSAPMQAKLRAASAALAAEAPERPSSPAQTHQAAPAERSAATLGVAPAPAAAPAREPPPLPKAPHADDDAQVAAAVAAGQVTRLPDPAIFARLPAITSADKARQELQRMGRTVQRSGGYWLVDGERRLTHVDLSELATAALRDEAMRAAGATA